MVMANGENESRIRRMDLNLYLSLPRSPPRRESELGSDLALGWMTLSGEERETLRAPYSLSNALYTPNPQPTGINTDYGDPIVTHESLRQQDVGDHIGHVPYSQFDHPVMPTVWDSGDHIFNSDSLGQEDVEDHIRHSTYLNFYSPESPTLRNSSDPMVHDGASNHDEYVPSSPSHIPGLPPRQVNEMLEQDGDTHIPFPASYVPVPPSFSLYRQTDQTIEAEFTNGSQQQDPLELPAPRFQRLIESHRRWWRARRFRSFDPYTGTLVSNGSLLGAGRIFRGAIMTSERPVETSGTYHKESEKGLVIEDSEEEKKGGNDSSANFDCNVCLDVAKEPVVTSCGHLFCWPCLYQWLHIHSGHKECPVCKGEVTKSNIIPIYGRGSSETVVERAGVENGDSNVQIPPRPRENRIESMRQTLCIPLLRRPREVISTWRLLTNEEIQTANSVEVPETLSMPGDLNATNSIVATRLRRMQRENNLEYILNGGGIGSSRNTAEVALNGYSGNLHLEGRSGSSSYSRNGIRLEELNRQRGYLSAQSSSDRREGITASVSSAMARVMTDIGSHSGASVSVNPQNTEFLPGQSTRGGMPTADQASVSSTAALIQGDIGVRDTSAEPNSMGSSRSPRRRRRNGASGSLDGDGGIHLICRRRRLN